MTDYTELIKALRELAEDENDEAAQAADAIEELQQEIKSLYKLLGTHPDPCGELGEPGVLSKENAE